MRKRSLKYALIYCALFVALLAGCLPVVTETPTTPTTSPTVTTPPSPIASTWTPPPLGNQGQLLPSVADVVAKVRPSVVAINTEFVDFDIFNRPFTQQGAGSGWIIDAQEGLIVTNNHVVEGAETITVTLADGRTFSADASKVFTDAYADLAILKIEATDIQAIAIGDSTKLRVGDWVVAIGNSLGLGISATQGIVSAAGVSLSVSAGQTLQDLIQTDAAINPGNSGGPLVNIAGEVIGITSAKVATVGVEGMGYAISMATAMPIIEQLVSTGYVINPWLGVVVTSVNQFTIIRYELSVETGAFITEVAPDSPADRAGLSDRDVIVEFNGKEITTAGELIQAIRSAEIRHTVGITYWRGSTKQTTQATLAESPPP